MTKLRNQSREELLALVKQLTDERNQLRTTLTRIISIAIQPDRDTQ